MIVKDPVSYGALFLQDQGFAGSRWRRSASSGNEDAPNLSG